MDAGQLGAYLPLVLLVALGYLLLIRPARRRARATAELQAALSPGDDVMLTSGIFATVVEVFDDKARLEVAPGMVIRVHRGAVAQIIRDQPPPQLPDDPVATPETTNDDDAGAN